MITGNATNSNFWFTTPDGESLRISALTKVGPVSVDDIEDVKQPGRFYFTMTTGMSGISVCFYDTAEEANTARKTLVGTL